MSGSLKFEQKTSKNTRSLIQSRVKFFTEASEKNIKNDKNHLLFVIQVIIC